MKYPSVISPKKDHNILTVTVKIIYIKNQYILFRNNIGDDRTFIAELLFHLKLTQFSLSNILKIGTSKFKATLNQAKNHPKAKIIFLLLKMFIICEHVHRL